MVAAKRFLNGISGAYSRLEGHLYDDNQNLNGEMDTGDVNQGVAYHGSVVVVAVDIVACGRLFEGCVSEVRHRTSDSNDSFGYGAANSFDCAEFYRNRCTRILSSQEEMIQALVAAASLEAHFVHAIAVDVQHLFLILP